MRFHPAESLDALVELYWDPVLDIANQCYHKYRTSLTRLTPDVDADDLAATFWKRLVEGTIKLSWNGRAPFDFWFRLLARHRIIDHIRQLIVIGGQIPTLPIDDPDLGIDPPSPDLSPESVVTSAEQHAKINQLIGYLSPREQYVIRGIVDGLSIAQMASETDVAYATVKNLLYSGRKKLRRLLKTENEAENKAR